MSALNGLKNWLHLFKQADFGRKSEKLNPKRFDLTLEYLETAMATIHAEDNAIERTIQSIFTVELSKQGVILTLLTVLIQMK